MPFRTLVAAAAAALLLAAPSSGQARTAPSTSRHDRQVVRFFIRHPKLAHTAAGERELWKLLGHVVTAVEHSRRAAAVPSIAHLLLWKCIAGYPGFRPGGGPGESWGHVGASNGTHFNILQMTKPWGQGAYYVADPTVLSPEQIMEKAEIGYRTNRFSRDWLTGQWGQTVGPCLGYAEQPHA